jgi:hypothetical protein
MDRRDIRISLASFSVTLLLCAGVLCLHGGRATDAALGLCCGAVFGFMGWAFSL